MHLSNIRGNSRAVSLYAPHKNFVQTAGTSYIYPLGLHEPFVRVFAAGPLLSRLPFAAYRGYYRAVLLQLGKCLVHFLAVKT